MNIWQRIVLFITAIILGVMLLFPPFHSKSQFVYNNWGRSFVFRPPRGGTGSFENKVVATVDSGTLIAQSLVVLMIGGTLCLALKDRLKSGEEK